MPLIRKLIDLRTCKAVVIPKSWLRYFEAKLGTPIELVAIEVDEALKITPYVEKKEEVKMNSVKPAGLPHSPTSPPSTDSRVTRSKEVTR